MKLIRLASFSTSTDEPTWSTNFNEDILIDANSSIALHNVSFETSFNVVVIGADNDTLRFKLKQSDNYTTVSLEHGTYSESNYLEFLADIQTKLNRALTDPASKQLGTSAQVTHNSDGKIEIAFRQSHRMRLGVQVSFTLFNINNIEQTAAGGGAFYYSSQSAQRKPDCTNVLYSAYPLGLGLSVWRCRLYEWVNPGMGQTVQGFTVGLSKHQPSTWVSKGTISADEAGYYIRGRHPNSEYEYSYPSNGGSRFDSSELNIGSGISPVKYDIGSSLNDIVSVRLRGGKIQLVLHQNNVNGDDSNPGTAKVIYEEDYDHQAPYYPYMVIHGLATNIKLTRLEATLDAFVVPNWPAAATDVGDAAVTTINPGNGSFRDTITYIDLMSHRLAAFLGFDPDLLILSDGFDNYEVGFEASKLFEPTILGDNFMVLLRDIPLDSYDGGYPDTAGNAIGKRRNILATIPVTANNGIYNSGVVTYEPSEKTFISVRNQRPQTFRNIRLELLKSDDTPVATTGLSVITLLIK